MLNDHKENLDSYSQLLQTKCENHTKNGHFSFRSLTLLYCVKFELFLISVAQPALESAQSPVF